MDSDELKRQKESNVFLAFLKQSGLSKESEVFESRLPREPDILYVQESGKRIAFELVEICDQSLAKLINNEKKLPSPECSKFLWVSDPTVEIIKHKLSRKYETSHPIELLCYTDGRTLTPSDQIISQIEVACITSIHPFRKVWFFGDNSCEIVWEKT